MAEYVQKFPGKISVAGLDSSEPVTAPQFNGALNGNATNATNAETAAAVPATLVPNNADLNDYRGENYWGKTYYADGSNTVQNLPYNYSAGFSLEVLRSGTDSTIQRLSAMTSEGNEIPTVYTRSVVDTATEDGTWSEWQEVVEANGTYPEMEVGKAEKLSMRANVSGAGQLGWYKVGTVTVEGLKAIQNTNASYSLFMLVNGANPPGTNNGAARSGIVEIDTAVGSGGQLQLENGYTAIKALCGNIDVNDFAVAIDSAGTTLTVYMDARENGVGTRTAFSVISEVYGAMSGSAFEFAWEFYGAAAPADAVYAVVRNNASGDEDGNNIKETYAKQNGTYQNMTVGKATADGNGNNIATAYATKAALNSGHAGKASTSGTYPNMTVGKATADGNGNNIASTYATKAALNSGLAGKASTSGSYPNMSVGKATNATNATNATHATSADSATSAGTADGLNLPDAVAYTVLKASNYYLASKLPDMGYGVFLITVGIKTNSSYGYGGTFSGVVAVDHQASGAGGNGNPFMFSAIIQNPTDLSGEQAILRVRALSGLGAIMIETLNSNGEVVDADTILSDTPSLSVRKLIAL